MRKVLNGKTEKNEQVFDFILSALQSPRDPERGARYDEMFESMNVMQVMNRHLKDDFVLLEQRDFDLVVEKVKLLPFNVIRIDLANMIIKIIDSEQVDVIEEK